ncbi:flagellar hook-length control protein FliK [Chachezhania sediminis]|uniref:flagellar hook-length control protein FliK n=1 Tax=Chachezhania sediminis TaxID=2599291 RepID=UPI00131D8159|nr:flagellar hook-length control protein FliK [Chachezhania sediminis]
MADVSFEGAREVLSAAGHVAAAAHGADSPGHSGPATLAGQSTVRQILPHLSDLSRRSGDRSVEIALEPAELGRVRMTLSTTVDGVMTLHVTADRPETLDLMRRHIAELSQEFRRLGYADVGMSFSAGNGATPERGQGYEATGTVAAQEAVAEPRPESASAILRNVPRTAMAGGLDIRI